MFMPTPKPSENTWLGTTVAEIGHGLASLDPGPLADLRRMSFDTDHPGTPMFWRLVNKHQLHRQQERWARIIQMMAILTDKGDPEGRTSPHAPRSEANGWRGLGHALCDGGDVSWGAGESDPRPMLSESRFARLLAAKGKPRHDLLRRAVRALAAKKPGGAPLDCADIAKLLLFADDPNVTRRLANHYYARLDRAQKRDSNEVDPNAIGEME
jgi:CRISPR system Cascade subunit CasB